MTVAVFASGSTGNCALVSWKDTHILVDAGISLRRIRAALARRRLRPEDLAGCGEKIGAALEAGAVCVLGPREQLEACGNLDLQTL